MLGMTLVLYWKPTQSEPGAVSRKEADDWKDSRRKGHWALGARPARQADRTPEPAKYSRLGREAPSEQNHGPCAVARRENQRSGQ